MSDSKMGHIQPMSIYVKVIVSLLVLTLITVWVSGFDFGIFNTLIAVGVATVKASLVVLFFMHGKYEGKITWAFIYYPLIILMILIGALFLDYGNRRADAQAIHAESFDALHGGDHGDTSHGGTGEKGGDAATHGAEGDHGHGTAAQEGDHGAEPGATATPEEPAADHAEDGASGEDGGH